jgi:hypothetical protein
MKPFRCTVSALAAAAVLLALVLPLAACGRGDDEASIEENLEETGTLDVLEQAGEDEYEPPADGELTESQVEMYLAVQERAVKIRKVTAERLREQEKEREAKGEKAGLMDAMRSLGDASDFVTAEIRAAKELGHNSAEYQWVQEQVMEAQVAKMSRGMQAQMGQAAQQFVEAMEQQLANTEDAEQKAAIEQQIAEYRQGLEESMAEEELEPGVAHNLELLERYQDRLDRIQELYQEMDEQQREEAAR